MAISPRATIAPCLWFDDQAEEAARFYTSIFPSSKIVAVSHYGKEGQEIHGKKPGSVMTVVFELDGHTFTALNGGPSFKFSEAISFHVHCETQEEIDRYWEKLSADPKSEQCGWVKDRFGLSWQIIPVVLPKLLTDEDPQKADRAMRAMMRMKKLDIAELKRAFEGG
jgi:predicted 3-demethylubiquinone-9 3-methyltransferase (glyoxalase superfamily)